MSEKRNVRGVKKKKKCYNMFFHIKMEAPMFCPSFRACTERPSFRKFREMLKKIRNFRVIQGNQEILIA